MTNCTKWAPETSPVAASCAHWPLLLLLLACCACGCAPSKSKSASPVQESRAAAPARATFNQFGLVFSYPPEWTSASDDFLAAVRNSLGPQLAPFGRTLDGAAVLQAPQQEMMVMITRVRTESPLSLGTLLAERLKVDKQASDAGDVTKMNRLEKTTVGSGIPAVIEDLERGAHGRARSYRIQSGHGLYELSFIVVDATLFDKYSAAIDSLAATVQVTSLP